MNKLSYPRDHLQEALKLRAPAWLKHSESVQALGELLDLLFFASLSTEEGDAIRIQAVIPIGTELDDVLDSYEPQDQNEPPQKAWFTIPLTPQPLNIDSLTKLSVATEFGRTALILSVTEESTLNITGIARRNPATNGGDVLFLSASAPGALSLLFADKEIMRYERGRLANPAPDLFYSDGPVRKAIRKSLEGLLADVKNKLLMPGDIGDRVFERLVRGMSATGRGGLILVHPKDSLDTKTEPPKHQAAKPSILASKVHQFFEASKTWINTVFRDKGEDFTYEMSQAINNRNFTQSAVDAVTDDIARLTAMDGALLLGPNLHIFGAGYKETTSATLPLYEASDAAGTMISPNEYSLGLHGTRHRAAVSFVASTGGFAFIASEDGPLKCLIHDGSRILFWRIRFPEL
ncbi:hypothetical protein HPP05_11795 [Corallococcus exiguus]|uniref:putative sensor domain DACNV-containing protein n=1 Tax=Corallococcus exiguus TaxID=83462 RepID=UPI0014941D4B|nr:hypothetical protein [Corallococcus exiguus]NPC70431.1 hypothetical protein [Corallococcus exiguus]